MTALEYMEKQAAKHRRNYEFRSVGGTPEKMLNDILEKVRHYEAAVEALRERDALMAEIKDMCFLCRHWNNGSGDKLCESCDDEDNFEWRGPQEDV